MEPLVQAHRGNVFLKVSASPAPEPLTTALYGFVLEFVWEACHILSEVCLAEITFSPCSLRVVILSHPALEVTVYQGSALGCIQVKTPIFTVAKLSLTKEEEINLGHFA